MFTFFHRNNAKLSRALNPFFHSHCLLALTSLKIIQVWLKFILEDVFRNFSRKARVHFLKGLLHKTNQTIVRKHSRDGTLPLMAKSQGEFKVEIIGIY